MASDRTSARPPASPPSGNGASAGLDHAAMVYGSDTEYLQAVLPFIREGIEAGERVSAVTTAHNLSLLQEALGPEARSVSLTEHTELALTPPRKVSLLHELCEEAISAGSPRFRVVGEALFGTTRAEQLRWVRYEAILNAVFASAPQTFLCAYDRRVLPDWLIETARSTHPVLHRDGERHRSPGYVAPAEVAREVTERLLPAARADGDELVFDMHVDHAELAKARQMVAELVRDLSGSDERADEVAIGLNEVVTNALEHGRGEVRVRCLRDTGRLACEVADGGPGFDDPLAGFVPPAPGQLDGRGLWLARQTLDWVELEAPADHAGFRAHLTVEV